MTATALSEAISWAEYLMDREHRGRGDREKSARYRLAKKIGVPESYLHRLRYKTSDMKDVAGSVYRALRIAYIEACEINEAAADRYRNERLERGGVHEATDEKPSPAGLGVVSAEVGEEE